MTRTPLSAATRANPEAPRVYSAPKEWPGGNSILARDVEGVQWHRHSCLPRGGPQPTKGLCAVAMPKTQQTAAPTLPLPGKFLIANDNPARIAILPVLRDEGSDQREPKDLSRRTLRRQPLPARILIANDNPTRIVILPVLRHEGSDHRESKDLSARTPRCQAQPARLLIANLELEFLATRRKQSPGFSSNRKYLAVFDLVFRGLPGPLVTSWSSLVAALPRPPSRGRLIDTLGLEFAISLIVSPASNFLIESKWRFPSRMPLRKQPFK